MKNRLRELRESRGYSREKLATLAGTTANQLVKLENGDRRMSDHWASRFAPHLGVQPFEILMPINSSVGISWIPLVGTITCGGWAEAIENSETSIPVVGVGPNCFALRPIGDSLNEVVSEEGFLVVDPDQRDLVNGRLYVVSNGDGETTAKEYRSDPPRLVPRSTNPEHPTIAIGQDDFRTIGRIVMVMTPH